MMCRTLAAIAVTVVVLPAPGDGALVARQGSGAVPPEELARIWDAEHVSPPLPPLVTHAEVVDRLRRVRESAPDLFSLEEIGRSVEGRSINHLWFGRGEMRVLLWSQMHGDEPTATSALFDLYEYIRRHRAEPAVSRLLAALTIHTVPMLNPDGAERYQRRNAQGIDVNRDALLLQTPEGRTLKRLRDRLNPRVGFNLHNQNWRTSAGKTGKPASISLLSVAFDEARTENEARLLTKRLCAVIRDALEPFAPGSIARYDDEFEVRAFGDNLTKWGTPVVLIETGPFPGAAPDPPLVRLNFIALVTALQALASGEVHRADPRRYESLPMNGTSIFHTLVRNGSIITGTGIEPFTGDVGIAVTRAVQAVTGERRVRWAARIEDLGDLRVFGALETIDATGLLVAPLFEATLKPGQTVTLPDPKRPRWGAKIPTLQVGQPGHVVLLKPAGAGYVVDRIVRFDER